VNCSSEVDRDIWDDDTEPQPDPKEELAKFFAIPVEFEQRVRAMLTEKISNAKNWTIPLQLRVPAFAGSDRSLFSFVVAMGDLRANGASWKSIEKTMKQHKFFHEHTSSIPTTKKQLKKLLRLIIDEPILFLTCSRGMSLNPWHWSPLYSHC
jgi:hypothetical protein